MTSWPNGWGWNDPAAIPPPGMYNMQRAGVPVTAHTSLQVDAVFTSLRVLSNAVIKMGPARAYTTGYDVDNRPYREWIAPEPSILTHTFGPMRQYDGMARTVVSMALFGEAFWLIMTRDRMLYPTSVEVLHPAFMDVKINKEDGGPDYWYGTGVHKVLLPREDVEHIPFLALPGATRGLNSIEYAGVSYALALAAMEYGQRWFSQGASPSFLLSTEQKLGTEEVERIAQKFLVEHSGLQASHLPLVVDSGMKVQKISSTPDEAQYLGTLEYARMCIAAWFGLPSHLAGGTADKGNVWGKTVQEQGIQLVDFTLSGYVVRIEEVLSSFLPKSDAAKFDESTIQRASAADQAARISALRTTAVVTQNDVRVEELHMKPLPGADTLDAPLASNSTPTTPGEATSAADKEDTPPGGNSGQ